MYILEAALVKQKIFLHNGLKLYLLFCTLDKNCQKIGPSWALVLEIRIFCWKHPLSTPFSRCHNPVKLSRNEYNLGDLYSSNNTGALSDGDERGKGENDGKIGSITDINLRNQNVVKNTYTNKNEYGVTHPNAISDSDEKVKGDNNGVVGSLSDINNRTKSVAFNKYSGNKNYPDF